ncbi:MAG TPA: hypothetical protein VMA74_13135 [Dyella sp.]|uniref:hypothetical protein n=1 Tax=Dyella sp. TaxID=1869338 RepID=UPI002C96CCA4|nr:hypothetical protein [Dyella sp.]HUB90662.1 hypothetical protein [Dyella sp.]
MRGGASLGSLLTGISVNRLGQRTALAINDSLALVLLWLFIGGCRWKTPLERIPSNPRLP